MLHGDDILDEAVATGCDAGTGPAVVGHVHALEPAGHRWHHHMHFPAYVLNPDPGRWSISVEGPEGMCSEVFPDEPVDALRHVDLANFGDLEKDE